LAIVTLDPTLIEKKDPCLLEKMYRLKTQKDFVSFLRETNAKIGNLYNKLENNFFPNKYIKIVFWTEKMLNSCSRF